MPPQKNGVIWKMPRGVLGGNLENSTHRHLNVQLSLPLLQVVSKFTVRFHNRKKITSMFANFSAMHPSCFGEGTR